MWNGCPLLPSRRRQALAGLVQHLERPRRCIPKKRIPGFLEGICSGSPKQRWQEGLTNWPLLCLERSDMGQAGARTRPRPGCMLCVVPSPDGAQQNGLDAPLLSG